ncbi:response regulator [Leptolyngbya sp. FACHB-321]|uniref:ATP-binding response regulator n=1 Tax=Leptolyngbya sp. FACHB-321 TaxID=2692807 RepID=UPI0016821A8C|nr:ATP-binding protein [Leptolyngbya sp. FACHB-321]MBD2037839.1 response regulator [Leptolyngbya sp. FACHB-321]
MDEVSKRVLLVEDSPTDADLMRHFFLRLEGLQWELIHVERLSSAITACSTHTVDIVLLDLRLPDSDEADTLVDFRASVPDVPVVVLTMMDDETLALQAMAGGAQDYLVKGQITPSLLARSLRYGIERGHILKRLQNSEQSMLKALEQEQELNLLKSSFISMASHEFRTPMTMIRTAVELLQNFGEDLTEAKRQQYFDRIKTAIHQVTQLLDEVLLLGSTEAGLRYRPEPVDLVKLCTGITEDLQFSHSDSHTIMFTPQGNCSNVVMDAALLRHILTNLLSNAFKYSPEGGDIQFKLCCENGTATFQIQDQGIGIPVKDQTHLFETFYRCGNVGSIQGTGLGLAIVKKCVELHQGRIQVCSDKGMGTTFTVALPLEPRSLNPAKPKTSEQSPKSIVSRA